MKLLVKRRKKEKRLRGGIRVVAEILRKGKIARENLMKRRSTYPRWAWAIPSRAFVFVYDRDGVRKCSLKREVGPVFEDELLRQVFFKILRSIAASFDLDQFEDRRGCYAWEGMCVSLATNQLRGVFRRVSVEECRSIFMGDLSYRSDVWDNEFYRSVTWDDVDYRVSSYAWRFADGRYEHRCPDSYKHGEDEGDGEVKYFRARKVKDGWKCLRCRERIKVTEPPHEWRYVDGFYEHRCLGQDNFLRVINKYRIARPDEIEGSYAAVERIKKGEVPESDGNVWWLWCERCNETIEEDSPAILEVKRHSIRHPV